MNSHVDITVQSAPVAAARLSLTPGRGPFMTQGSVDALEAPGTN